MYHLLHNKTAQRFLKYVGIAGSTFAFDLLLVFVLTEFLSIPYYVSTALGFLVAVSCNYFLSRKYVFKGTERKLHHGYLYFVGVALGGMALVTGSVTALVTFLGMHYLVARILVACVVGTGNYLFNLHVNFKVAGKHQ